jgi:site-specific DNA recombinase
LNEGGFALRNFSTGNENVGDRKRSKRCGHTPYGFAYLDGQLVVDPKEHLIVRKIIKFHQSGKSNQSIADELNNQKIPTRLKGKWQKSVIHSIIKRHKENNK